MTSSRPRRPLLAALAVAPFVAATGASAQGELVNIQKQLFSGAMASWLRVAA